MQGKDIHNLVLVKLDEFTPFGPDSGATLLAGGDNLDEVKPIYRYVSEHLAEAANEMLMGIALHHLRYKSPNVDCVADEDDGCIGSIVMPSDYLRLHTLWLKGWAHPVHETIKAGHPLYIKQFNPWSRGHADKPIVAEGGVDVETVQHTDVTAATLLRNIASNSDGSYHEIDWATSAQHSFGWEVLAGENVRIDITADRYRATQPDDPSGFDGFLGDWSIQKNLAVGERVMINVYNELATTFAAAYPNESFCEWLDNVRVEIYHTSASASIGIYDGMDVTHVWTETIAHNTLHYYSVEEGRAHEIKEFKYIPKFNDDEEYEQKVAEAIALHCARKVCEVFGSTEQVGVLTNEINSVMENMRL